MATDVLRTLPHTMDMPEDTLKQVQHKLLHLRRDLVEYHISQDLREKIPGHVKRAQDDKKAIAAKIDELEKKSVPLMEAAIPALESKGKHGRIGRFAAEIERITGKKFKPAKAPKPPKEDE